jgi:hypothetical protein
MGALGDWLLKTWRENWFFLLAIGGVVAALIALRTPASAVGSLAEADALLQAGRPTLVEFYSNT